MKKGLVVFASVFATLLLTTFILWPQWKTLETWGVKSAMIALFAITGGLWGAYIGFVHSIRKNIHQDASMTLRILYGILVLSLSAVICGFRIDQNPLHNFAIAGMFALMVATMLMMGIVIIFSVIKSLFWVADRFLYDPNDPESHY